MDRISRPSVASVFFFVWILFDSRTLPFASAEHARRADQVDVQADTVFPERIGRFLLQQGNANANTPSAPGVSSGGKLPVASIVIGSVAAGIAFLFLLLTTIGYFQNRLEVKVVDSQQHHDDGPASSTSSFKIAPASNMGELEV